MNSALDIALSGMRASQLGMTVTGHNIANAGVEGYTRQRPLFATRQALLSGPGMVNGGVETIGVQRVQNLWVASHIREQLGQSTYYESMHTRLSEVEAVFNETGDDGLNNALNTFYDTLANLESNPESYGVRVTVIGAAQSLTAKLQSMRTSLDTMDRENRLELNYKVDQLNALFDNVAELNGQIASGLQSNANVSNLMDDRDKVLEELCSQYGCSVLVQPDGSFADVSIDGSAIVLANGALHLEVNGGGLRLEGTAVSVNVDRGEVATMLEMRNEILPRYSGYLDSIADALTTDFNAVHSAGFGLDGSTGNNLFTGNDARTITVNSAIVSDANLLAASATGETGDSGAARLMRDLRDQQSIGTQTVDEFYETVVGGIGAETLQAENQSSAVGGLVEQLINRRDGITGVSLDEEMANLIKYQQSYNAAARMISIVQEMMDRLIDLGR